MAADLLAARPQSSRPASSRKAAMTSRPASGTPGIPDAPAQRRPFRTAYTPGQFGWTTPKRPYTARAAPADLPRWASGFQGLKAASPPGQDRKPAGGNRSLYVSENSIADLASFGRTPSAASGRVRPQTARVVTSCGLSMEPCRAADTLAATAKTLPSAADAATPGGTMMFAPPTPPSLSGFTRNVAATRNRNVFHSAVRGSSGRGSDRASAAEATPSAHEAASALRHGPAHTHTHSDGGECEMCDFVKDQLDTFDKRRRAKVALSISNDKRMIQPNYKTRHLPPMVQSLFQNEVRAKSDLIQRLAAYGINELKKKFVMRMRPNGSISKADFVELLGETAGCCGSKSKTEILKFYDSFSEHKFSTDVSYTTFFMLLDRYLNPSPDPRLFLTDAWGALNTSSGSPMMVTVFEMQALLSAVAAVDPPLAVKIRNALATHSGLSLYQNGECSTKELVAAIEASPLLLRLFTSQPNPGYLAQLEDELRDGITTMKQALTKKESKYGRARGHESSPARGMRGG